MGCAFDGSDAEYTAVPSARVMALETDSSWDRLGALPKMLKTACGALLWAFRVARGDRLLIRGGATSIGLAEAFIACTHRIEVGATSGFAVGESLIRAAGADHLLLDDGAGSR
jgi:NADPH:quinone reductase-like Zn-dependent oxidoreductase